MTEPVPIENVPIWGGLTTGSETVASLITRCWLPVYRDYKLPPCTYMD